MSHDGSISAMSLDEIQRARRVTRRSLATLRNSLVSLTQTEASVDNCNEVEMTLLEFNNLRSEFKRLTDAELDEIDTTNKTAQEIEKAETELYKEVDDNTKTVIKYSSWLKSTRLNLSAAKSRESLLDQSRSVSSDNSSKPPDIHLPKIEVPKFNGDKRNFLEWKGLFQNLIHDAPSDQLSNVRKLYYLKLAMVGKAADILQGYKNEDSAYPEAWAYLSSRYDNRRAIIRTHFADLLALKTIKNESELRSLLDQVNRIVRSLKVCGEDTEVGCMNSFLCYYISTKLDPRTRREFETTITETTSHPKFNTLLKFLQNRSFFFEDSEENRKVEKQESSKKSFTIASPTDSSSTFTAATVKCHVCKSSHRTFECDELKSKSPQERHNLVKKLNLCQNCLSKGHTVVACKSKYSCSTCNRRHHSLLHFAPKQESQTETSDKSSSHDQTMLASLNATIAEKLVILPSAVVRFRCGKFEGKARILLDSCSQPTLVADSFVRRFKLRYNPLASPTDVSGVGGPVLSKNFISIELISRVTNFSVEVEAKIVPASSMSYSIHHTFEPEQIVALKSPKLADPAFSQKELNIPGIDLIVGAEFYEKCILNSSRSIGDLTLRQTVFGWTVSGLLASKKDSTTSFFCFNACSSDLTEQEITESVNKYLFVEDTPEITNTHIDECTDHFYKNYSRADDNKFVVRLPFKVDRNLVAHNRNAAVAQLLRVERTIDDKNRSRYCAFMAEYLASNHMEPVLNPTENGYFMPHRHVLRPDSTTTSLRVVFNASSKGKGCLSLNDALMIGPSIQRHLFDILVSMRSYTIVFCADIAKMYRMVWVHPEDRSMQKILWRDNPQQPISEYQLKTVTYGTAPASFLATKCLQVLANSISSTHPVASNHIINSFYMDDLICGADTLGEAIELQQVIHSTLADAGFLLRKYASNSTALIDQIPEELLASSLSHTLDSSPVIFVLGITWIPTEEQFRVKTTIELLPDNLVITKRKMLSYASRIFDPLGFVDPVTITGKLIIQRLWSEGSAWDNPANRTIAQEFRNYYRDLEKLSSFTIPRFYFHKSKRYQSCQLIGFADASDKAYCAAVYMRSTLPNGKVICTLVASRTRVAPLKPVSVPRLELQAAVLLATLIDRVAQNLHIDHSNVHCFSDSTVVLCWLSKPSNSWKSYVANRVAKIISLVAFSNWFYVPTDENPADLATRGISVENFYKNTMWVQGPDFLYAENPFSTVIPSPDTHLALERRKVKSSFTTFVSTSLISRFSSYRHLIVVIGYIRRFKLKAVDKLKFDTVTLTKAEFDLAHFTAIRMVQNVYFAEDIERIKNQQPLKQKSPLLKFHPFLDDFSVLRIGGRLEKSSFSADKKHPILLPAKSHLALLFVRYVHEKYFHAGRRFLESYLAAQYWLIGGRTNLIKKVCAKCVICCRFRKETSKQLMGQLPVTRLSVSFPFAYVGVDLAGPFQGKCVGHRSLIKHKIYLAIFICLSTRAVHLELVSDLSTARFLESLQRFISRRGTPKQLLSDNATNFQGARNFFLENAERFTSFATAEMFTWQFIPPRAPHHGGIWEAAVRSAKAFLLKTTRGLTLTFDEYITLFSRVEAVMNSRPICYSKHVAQGSFVLTPGHFLIGRPFTEIPSLDFEADKQIALSKRLELIKTTLASFWRLWSRDYVNSLQVRQKWRLPVANVRTDQLVLVKDDTPAFQWPLGVVEATQPGSDGLVRVVDVRMRGRVLRRPISKIVPLPVEADT